MTNAPSRVDQKQLEELFLATTMVEEDTEPAIEE
jgi:hypothetical protein